jgi:hypothetical protein
LKIETKGNGQEILGVKIFNLNGQMVFQKATKNLSMIEELNLGHLPKGIYILRVNINGREDEKKWIYR